MQLRVHRGRIYNRNEGSDYCINSQMEISIKNCMELVVPSLLCLKSFVKPIQSTQSGMDTNLTINYVPNAGRWLHFKEV